MPFPYIISFSYAGEKYNRGDTMCEDDGHNVCVKVTRCTLIRNVEILAL
jgi:hypothetical protein